MIDRLDHSPKNPACCATRRHRGKVFKKGWDKNLKYISDPTITQDIGTGIRFMIDRLDNFKNIPEATRTVVMGERRLKWGSGNFFCAYQRRHDWGQV